MSRGSNRLVRFGLVGGINTMVDTALFLILRQGGFPLLLANLCSTATALMASIYLHHRFTFQHPRRLTYTQRVLYIAVTLSGSWVLQPLVMAAFISLNHTVHYVQAISALLGHPTTVANLLPKLAAIMVTIIWNYVLYSKVVFVLRDTRTRTLVAGDN